MVKNGKPIDSALIQNLNSFPLRGIALTLKIYDKAGMMNESILKKCINPIIARKNETNLYDLKHIFNIYSKHLYLDSVQLMKYFEETYRLLQRNIYDETILEMWEYIPKSLNANKLPISFVEEMIKTIKILRKRGKFSEKIWKIMMITFEKIQNLEVRVKLQKL